MSKKKWKKLAYERYLSIESLTLDNQSLSENCQKLLRRLEDCNANLLKEQLKKHPRPVDGGEYQPTDDPDSKPIGPGELKYFYPPRPIRFFVVLGDGDWCVGR